MRQMRQAASKTHLAPLADRHWLMYALELWVYTAAQDDLGWAARLQQVVDLWGVGMVPNHPGPTVCRDPSHHWSATKQGVLSLGRRVWLLSCESEEDPLLVGE